MARMARGADRPGRRRGLTVAGVVLLVIGLACFGWVGYQFIGTDIVSRRAFQNEQTGLQERWENSPSTNDQADTASKEKRIPGQAMGLLRIPAFGADYVVPIMTGTDAGTLANGVGWYEQSVRPGEKGNFALAGHRITHGEPFSRLLELNVGALVEIETREAFYTYKLDTAPRDLTVPDTASWVLDADPVNRTNVASKRYLTLTTCQDLFHSPDRSVGFGTLVETRAK